MLKNTGRQYDLFKPMAILAHTAIIWYFATMYKKTNGWKDEQETWASFQGVHVMNGFLLQ